MNFICDDKHKQRDKQTNKQTNREDILNVDNYIPLVPRGKYYFELLICLIAAYIRFPLKFDIDFLLINESKGISIKNEFHL